MIDARLADMPFLPCEQELSYWRRFQDAIDARVKVEDGDSQLQCWFLDKTYTSQYLMHGGAHRTHTMTFELCKRTAVQNPLFVS